MPRLAGQVAAYTQTRLRQSLQVLEIDLLDHLVVAARTLEEGRRWCERTLGVAPVVGKLSVFFAFARATRSGVIELRRGALCR